ncbi:MAG: hypothetical protein FJ095_15045 [Deltaproteobacteria bacterium]|nr:hypothetical protein [Deltaproteobacteria bacterium]
MNARAFFPVAASLFVAALAYADPLPSSEPAALPCAAGAVTPEALCGCLLEDFKKNAALQGETPRCSVVDVQGGLGAPELVALWYGNETPGEGFHLLAVREAGVVRPLADLGHDYSPGAFGVENFAKVLGGAVRKVGARSPVVVRSEQRDRDYNAAGLELCLSSADLETVCSMGDGSVPTRCMTVPVALEAGCGPGVEPTGSDLTADVKATLAELRKSWKRTKGKLRWSIAEDGKLVVQKVSGDADLIPAGTVGKHTLFPPAPPKPAAGAKKAGPAKAGPKKPTAKKP